MDPVDVPVVLAANTPQDAAPKRARVNQVFGFQGLERVPLADLAQEEDHIIADQEPIDIVKGFEVIKVEVENTPWFQTLQFEVESTRQLYTARQPGKR